MKTCQCIHYMRWECKYHVAFTSNKCRKKYSRRSRVQGLPASGGFHSRPRIAFGMRIYEKSIGFVRPNPKFGAKLVIIWENKHF